MVGRYSNSMTYDVENRLTRNSHSSSITDYVYNGDGARVKKIVTVGAAVTTTIYVGNLYEHTSWTGGSTWSKYYYFGGKRVAMRTASGVTYRHSDHLGSTSVTTNAGGGCTSAQWYKPYGENRAPAPTLPCAGSAPTDFGFTGQRFDVAELMDYKAREYDFCEMIKIWIPKNDLHVELFRRRNIFQAWLVVLNVLTRDNPKLRAQILKRVRPTRSITNFQRFLFKAMLEMIQSEGQVDVEQVRCNIPLWVGKGGSPEFIAECLGNYALMLSYRPTEAQVERAIKIITSPPPPRRMYKTEPHAHPKAKARKRTQKGK